MSKYNALWEYIQKKGEESIRLTFEEIQDIAGIPIDHSFLKYKKELTETEYKCLENYREKLPGFRIVFIAPVDIDDSYYAKRWEGISIIKFDTWSADSLNDYNRLLMTPEFYNRFSDYEYMFILQLDGWLIKGEEELKRFLQMGFDYIGAPWRDGGYRYYKRVIRGAKYLQLFPNSPFPFHML